MGNPRLKQELLETKNTERRGETERFKLAAGPSSK
jgi:hypothetical protein